MITNYNMPSLDGLSLTRQATAIAPEMPVILMTGNISSKLPNMAEMAGVVKVIGKPFNCEALLEAIRGVTVVQRVSQQELIKDTRHMTIT